VELVGGWGWGHWAFLLFALFVLFAGWGGGVDTTHRDRTAAPEEFVNILVEREDAFFRGCFSR